MQNSIINAIQLGAKLVQHVTPAQLELFTQGKVHPSVHNKVSSFTWCCNALVLPHDGKVVIINKKARLEVDDTGVVSVEQFPRLADINYLAELVAVLHELHVAATTKAKAEEYFTPGIPATMSAEQAELEYEAVNVSVIPPELQVDRSKEPSLLPLRKGPGKRKSRDAVSRILRRHLLDKDDLESLTVYNADIHKELSTMGGVYTDPLTDVVIRHYQDDSVILEADAWHIVLPANKVSGHLIPYAQLASVHASDEADLRQIAGALSAIRTLLGR